MVVRECLAALLAFERLNTRVRALMLYHVGFLEERLVAVGTLERPIPVVDPQVGDQMLVLDKSFAAELTFKGLFLLMQPTVQFKARVLRKGLMTFWTLIWSFASVPFYMGPKVTLSIKGLITLRTLVSFLLVVGEHVRL